MPPWAFENKLMVHLQISLKPYLAAHTCAFLCYYNFKNTSNYVCLLFWRCPFKITLKVSTLTKNVVKVTPNEI